MPVDYFHVVFTLPAELAPVALQNKALIYNLLFRATAETLLEIAAGWKGLEAKIGFFAILHTWGQKLDRLVITQVTATTRQVSLAWILSHMWLLIHPYIRNASLGPLEKE